MSHPARLLLPLALTGACKPLDPAPTELDALMHYLWLKLDAGEDAELTEAVANLHATVDGDAIAEVVDGLVSPITPEGAALVGRADVDPSQATGVFMLRPVDCPMPLLEQVLAYQDQHEIYVGVYDEHARTFTSSQADFLAGTADRLTWSTVYTSTVLGATYTVNSSGTLRRLRPATAQDRAALFSRTVMDQPADFGGGSNYIDQDYHLEVYWDRGDTILHLYALWKDNNLVGQTDEALITQRLVLNNLVSWDDGTEQICAQGLP